MQKLNQMRMMFARMVMAVDYNNVVLGYVMLDIIENTYLPKLNRKLQDLREEDVSERAKLDKVISLWEKEAKDIKKGNKNVWNVKPAKAIEGIAAARGIKDINAVEEIIQNYVGSLYSTDKTSMAKFTQADPEEGVNRIQGLWVSRAKDRAKDMVKVMLRHNPQTSDFNKVMPTKSDEGSDIDPLDKLVGDAPVSEREIDTFIKQMKGYVLRNSKIKSDEYLTAMFNVWAKALDKRDSIGDVQFKRDVYPEMADRFGAKYNAALISFKRNVVPVMAKFMVEQMGGNQRFYEKLITSKKDERTMQERIASDFYSQEMATWLMEPALRIQEVLKKAYAEV
jgi:hypothetical protein